MKDFFTILLGFIQKELKQTLRDPRMRMVLFVAPIMQLIIFGVALSNETRNVRLAVVQRPNDVLMNDIYMRALASQWFIPAKTTGSDPFQWIYNREADVVLVAPEGGLSANSATGQSELQALINAQNGIRAQSIESYVRAVAMEVFAKPEFNIRKPMQFVVKAMYNPTFNTSMYMVPGVMSMLVCLVTIILTSMSVAREREMGTFETLVAAPINSFHLLLGKTVPFVLLGMVQVPLILTAAVLLFGLPVRGPLLLLATASFLMILTTVSIGILISTIARNQQQAMLGGFLYLFPSILLSGLMFPVENMPVYMRFLSDINPLTHFINLLRNLLLKGGNAEHFVLHAGILFLLAFVLMNIAASRFRTTL